MQWLIAPAPIGAASGRDHMNDILDGEAAVAALEDQRFAAMRAQNWGELDRLLSDDLTYTHSSGVRDSKTDYLRAMQAGIYRYFSMEVKERRVRLFGDTALVFSRVVTSLASKGVDKLLDNVTLAVWVRDHGAWRMVAYQPTMMPKT